MKTLADLKRKLQLGQKVEIVWHLYGIGPRIKGIREVKHVQTTAVAFANNEGGLSWLYWEKSGNYLITEKGFAVLYDDPERKDGAQLPLIVYEFR